MHRLIVDHLWDGSQEWGQRLTEADLSAAGKDRVASQARALAAWAVREVPGIALVELAKRLNRDAVSLSNAARRLEVCLDDD